MLALPTAHAKHQARGAGQDVTPVRDLLVKA